MRSLRSKHARRKRMIVNIIAWVVLGAIAGYIAGLLVKGDERWGVIGHR